MMHKLLHVASIMFAITVVFSPAHGAELAAIEKIKSPDVDIQQEGLGDILNFRRETIAGLMMILETGQRVGGYPEQSSIIASINALGELRAIAAVPLLIEYIGYFPRQSESSDIPPATSGTMLIEKKYVAVGALIEIGNPSIPLLLEEMAKTYNTRVFLNCGWVIHQIEGLKISIIRFEDELRDITDGKKRERLENLISELAVGLN